MANKPLGIILPITIGANGYFHNTTDAAEQIRSNLTNLLLTRRGERPFQPEFGSNVHRTLFEPNQNEAIVQTHAEIQATVAQWMPFIRINDVTLQDQSEDGHEVSILVDYTILTTNSTDTIQLVF